MDDNLTYPRQEIDPKLKVQKPFLLQMSKAFWDDTSQKAFEKIFYYNRQRYEEVKDYVLGMQSITKYKPMLNIDEASKKSWTNIDWSIMRWVSRFRTQAISIMMKNSYNIICEPIDPLAKDELDKYYADARVRIMMRDALKGMGSDVANSAQFKAFVGDAEDLEELEMQIDFGSKRNRAMEAELAIGIVFNDNDSDDKRKEILESIFDYGVAGYKDFVDANERVKYRTIDPRNILTNYCTKWNFTDMDKVGEVIDVSFAELSKYFGEEDMKKISEQYATNNTRNTEIWKASAFNRGFDRFKAKVLDFEFLSQDKKVKEIRANRLNNPVVRDASYDKIVDTSDTDGGETPANFEARTITNCYRVKWVVGTDLIYEYGKCNYQKRDRNPETRSETKTSYTICAPDFHEMRCLSKMEQLIPLADALQLTVYKLQNAKNRWMPYIMDIDFEALETVSLGKGGADLEPGQILDMLFQTNILLTRRKDIGGNNNNYKAVHVEQTQMHEELIVLAQEIARLINEMRDICGLNDITDGSTPNPKTLVPVANAAIVSTNNALYNIINAERYLLEKLSKCCVQRLRNVLIEGDYAGYYKAIGTNSVKYFKLSKGDLFKDYGITLQAQTTDEQKNVVMGLMQEDIRNGFLDTGDAYMAIDMYDTKQAFQFLTYKVKKNKQRMQQEALQNQQEAAQGQQQIVQMAEQAKQETAAQAHQFKMEEIAAEAQANYTIEAMKKASDVDEAKIQAEAKILANQILATAKTQSQETASTAHLIGKHIDASKQTATA